MSNFILFKKNISFLEASDRYYMATLERNEAMRLAEKDFADFYRSCGNIRTVLQNYMERAGSITKYRALDVLFSKLPSIDIYDVTEKVFAKKCSNLDEAGDAFDEIVDLYNEIEEELALEKAYREERKESRGQWVGGGFGLGGAIKGAMTAGALNMVSGLGHSMANAIGNASSERTAMNAKERLYNSEETYAKLCIGVKFSVWDIFVAYMEMVNEHFDDVYFANNEFDEDRAKALFENAKKFPDKREDLLVEALSLCPYYADALIYVFEKYPSERESIRSMAKTFAVDISECYERTLEKQYSESNRRDEKAMHEVKKSILAEMANYGIKSSPTLERLHRDYLMLIYRTQYANSIPGQRTAALKFFREYEMTEREKAAFCQEHKVWELKREFRLSFNEQEQSEMLADTYKLLVRNGVDKESIEEVVVDFLQTFGYSKGAVPLALFEMLCGITEALKQRKQSKLVDKPKALNSIFQYLEQTISQKPWGKPGCIEYQRDAVLRQAQRWEHITVQPGETPVLAHSDFVLTDRRFVFIEDGKTKDVQLSFLSTISYKKEFLSSNLRFSTNQNSKYEFHIVYADGFYPDSFALGINEVVSRLKGLSNEVEGNTEQGKEEVAILKAQCVKKHDAEVAVLGMESIAAQLICEGDAALQQHETRKIQEEIDAIFASFDNSPSSAAMVWKQLRNTSNPPQSYEDKLAALHNFFLDAVNAAQTVAQLDDIELVRAEIVEADEDPRLLDLEQEILTRRPIVEKSEQESRQKGEISKILENYEPGNAKSIVNALELLADYPEALCAENRNVLEEQLKNWIRTGQDEPALSSLLEHMNALSAEHYGNWIVMAKARLSELDIFKRTYRSVVFDSVEDIIIAREEEKKLDVIMRSVSKDDLESIQNAVEQVSASPSKIREYYLGILHSYQEELSVKARTYRDVVYETAEEAESAKECYVAAREIMSNLDFSDEAAVQTAYAQINSPCPAVAAYVKQLQDCLMAIDVQKRTVDGILFDTVEFADVARREFAQIQQWLAKMDRNNEESLLQTRINIEALTTDVKVKYLEKVQCLLQEYDVQMRTFRGVTYETREETMVLRAEERIISAQMAGISENDEASMQTAVQAINALTTFLKNDALTILSRKLEEFDIRMRTFRGVLYPTREEASLVANEFARAQEIMAQVNGDDEASILNAQKEILKLTTHIRDERYAVLEKMWEEFDLRQRTYVGIVFATRNQAANAKCTREEFLNMFATMDLQQRSTLMTLSNYIEDTLQEELRMEAVQMVDALRATLDEVDFIIKRDAEIDPATEKKASSELYSRAEAVLPKMQSYRISTTAMQAIKDKHYASLNVFKKAFSFFKSKK